MSHTEYREIIQLPATRLFLEDVIRLARLLTDVGGFSKLESEFRATFGSKVVSAKNVDELLAEITEEFTDQLSINVHFWTQNEIRAGVSLTLYHNYVHCSLFAYDAKWFHGTREQVKIFFRDCRPWYSRLKNVGTFRTSFTF